MINPSNTDENVRILSEAIASKAGVDVEAAMKVLKALNIASQVDIATQLSNGAIDPDSVKLAYRVASGAVVA